MPAYLLLLGGLVLLLRGRRGLERHAITDGIIVCPGGGTLSVARRWCWSGTSQPGRPGSRA